MGNPRFGPRVLSWKSSCSSRRDFVYYGILQAVGYWIVSGVTLLVWSMVGRSSAISFVTFPLSLSLFFFLTNFFFFFFFLQVALDTFHPVSFNRTDAHLEFSTFQPPPYYPSNSPLPLISSPSRYIPTYSLPSSSLSNFKYHSESYRSSLLLLFAAGSGRKNGKSHH